MNENSGTSQPSEPLDSSDPADPLAPPAPSDVEPGNQWHYTPAKDLGLPHAQRVLSLQRESGLITSTLHSLFSGVLRCYLKRRFHLRVNHPERLPDRPPFVLVANHSSHLDALVLGAALPWRLSNCVFPIAAGDVFFQTQSTATFATTMMNLLPMWRENCGAHALKELRARLIGDQWDKPCGYILFPEGGRTRDGNMLPFKIGLGMIVAQADVPVIPCWIDGAFEAWHPDAPRPGRGQITITIGQALNFKDVRNRRAGWEKIATDLQQAVAALAPIPQVPTSDVTV